MMRTRIRILDGFLRWRKKRRAKSYYLRYLAVRDRYSCGDSLFEYMRPDAVENLNKAKKIVEELKNAQDSHNV